MRRLKRLLALGITFSILICGYPSLDSYAKTSTQDKLNEAQKEANEAKENVDEAQKEVDNLTNRKNAFKKELNGLNAQLEEIVAKLNELDEKIFAKEDEIRQTEEALAEAKVIEETQYQAMKKQIQFMYEDSQSLYLEIMFAAKSFSNFITLSNYIDSIAIYSKKRLNEFKKTRESIEILEATLEKEKEELDVLKAETEVEKAGIMQVIENTKGKISEYSSLIDDAEAELLAYEAELKKKNENVAALQKQLEEERRLSLLAASSAWRDISQVNFDDGDRYLLAVLIYCEAGGEPYEGKVAVGSVVINRVLSSVYPSTVSGVIYQPYQFSPVLSGRLAYYLSIGRTNDDCYKAADAAMSGVTNVGSCLHFRTPIPGLTGIQIGNHVFY